MFSIFFGLLNEIVILQIFSIVLISALTGGPLGCQKYPLWQFHLHWGSGDGWGSCHTLNGKSFAGEVHFATWNKDRYESASIAVDHPDGVVIMAFFLDLGKENDEFREMIANLHKIRYSGETILGLKPIRLEKFLPEHMVSCINFKTTNISTQYSSYFLI